MIIKKRHFNPRQWNQNGVDCFFIPLVLYYGAGTNSNLRIELGFVVMSEL